MFFIHSINDYLLHWRWSRLQLEWFTPLEGGSYMYGFDLTLLGHMMRSALYIIYKETLSTPTHLAQPHPSSPIYPFVINSPIFSISLTNIQAFCIFSFSNNETWSYHSIKIKKKLKRWASTDLYIFPLGSFLFPAFSFMDYEGVEYR